MALFERAIALEPGCNAALVDTSLVYVNQAGYGLRPAEEADGLAREALTRAQASDPEIAKANDGLGRIAMSCGGDLAAAAQH